MDANSHQSLIELVQSSFLLVKRGGAFFFFDTISCLLPFDPIVLNQMGQIYTMQALDNNLILGVAEGENNNFWIVSLDVCERI